MTRFRAGALGAWLLLVALLAANAPAALADDGTATWYGEPYHGRRMANGQVFDMYDPTTTACNIYPLGTWLRVTNPANGRTIVVQVRDTGGFQHALDLSYAAFYSLADPNQMHLHVEYEVVSGPEGEPLDNPVAEEPAAPEPIAEPSEPVEATTAEEPAAMPASGLHEVQPGESLGSIARRYGLSVDDLIAWNGITDPDLVRPGQVLALVPEAADSASQAQPAAPSAIGGIYVVQEGDMLWQIAEAYGVTTEDLLALNGLAPDDPIHPGQELYIPAGATSGGNASNSGGGAVWYTVEEGDTLASIAALFDTSTNTLLALNGIDDPDLIVPGQELRVQ